MAERRAYPRLQLHLPVELVCESAGAPLRGETSDISLGGCYVGSLFPFEVGTPLELRIRLKEDTLIAVAVVATCDRQVGNGIRFVRMLAEDQEQLRDFLEAAAAEKEIAESVAVDDADSGFAAGTLPLLA